MRIGVDFHVLDALFQGSRTHLLELFPRVFALRPLWEFFLFLDGTERLASAFPVFRRANVHLIKMPKANPVFRLTWQLPRLQRSCRLDILHTQYITPIPSFCPCVVTIHDILFETMPRFFEFSFALRSKLLVRLSARRSAHVFTISKYSRNEIAARYGVNAGKLTVTNMGVDKSRFFAGQAGHELVRQRGLQPGRYILTTGRLEPRKNHVTLLEAYSKLGADAPPLVMVGQRHFGYRAVLDRIHALNLEQRVIVLEDVDDNELPAIYRHASLFVYPSWGEGFGIPVLEAMASGVPVISSSAGALSEVVDGAGVLVGPGDVKGLHDAMSRLLGDAEAGVALSHRGLARSALFRWEEAAEKAVSVYERCAAGNRG